MVLFARGCGDRQGEGVGVRGGIGVGSRRLHAQPRGTSQAPSAASDASAADGGPPPLQTRRRSTSPSCWRWRRCLQPPARPADGGHDSIPLPTASPTCSCPVNNISLNNYMAGTSTGHYMFLPHSAGRYLAKCFHKALCPLTKSLMMPELNNRKIMAVCVIKHTMQIIYLNDANPIR